jgi:hypothetical protein
LASDQRYQDPVLDLFTFLVDQLAIPMDFAVASPMRLHVDNFGDDVDRIPRKHWLQEIPTSDVDERRGSNARCCGTESDQDGHAQHSMSDRLPEWALGGELGIHMEWIIVAG